ncbi:STAS domain-containing protein [Nocardioides sp. AE5]|uniref:STAS domain-containing protein n=1 Tax=Nocardioides sp. AE5 TaxID=2962573 RepID=UPI002882A7D0|nr:STAS domain-containing protein [Nocardioides sp. AE5]MDT0201008.1 STAS domain-containing protein [Nocardioides sp. AE5]
MDIRFDGPALVLAGHFDARSTMEARAAIYQHIEQCEGDEVIIDLTDVDGVDVTALKVLAVATRSAGREGQHLRLRGCGPAVRRLLHVSHLFRLVEVERAA